MEKKTNDEVFVENRVRKCIKKYPERLRELRNAIELIQIDDDLTLFEIGGECAQCAAELGDMAKVFAYLEGYINGARSIM